MTTQDETIPAWWRVPQNKAPIDLRPGDVVKTPLGDRRVVKVRQEDTVVVDFEPGGGGPDKQVFGADDFQNVVELGETMPTIEELVAVVQAVDEGEEFATYLSITAYDEAVRRGWLEKAHRLTPAGRMVFESIKAKAKL